MISLNLHVSFQLTLHVKCYVVKAYFESRLIALNPITACFFKRGNAVKRLLLLQEKVEIYSQRQNSFTLIVQKTLHTK